jgi:hypothetical protein
VLLEPGLDGEVEAVSGAIIIELEDGTSPVAAITQFHRGSTTTVSFENGVYWLPAGDWSVTIKVYDHVLEALGSDAEAVFTSGFRASSSFGLPVLELAPPFRWATDDEIPLQMQVKFEGFVVRRGCGDLSVACSQTRAVQVIPIDRVSAPAPVWPDVKVFAESPAPRPVSDLFYLDPGPLTPRGAHDVVWTGQEMIVWGGATGDRAPDLIEGAAFDPVTDSWRILSPAPLAPSQSTRAVWTGNEMVVIAPEATVAYEPTTDTWRTVGAGLSPPKVPGLTVWTGDRIVTWAESGIHEFLFADAAWMELPNPGFGSSGTWRGALRVLDGRLYAVGNTSGNCSGRSISEWTGSQWRHLPQVSLATAGYADCSYPNQTGADDGQLIIWDQDLHPTMAYNPKTESWSQIASIPLDGTDFPSGPVANSEPILVPHFGQATIYDSSTETWTSLTLPGYGRDTDMIWTGSEFLMWGATCCYGTGSTTFRRIDAWRWQPPG